MKTVRTDAFRRVDIHAHLNFAAFDADRDEAAERALGAGTAFINTGTQADTSRKAVELAEKYGDGAYAAVGLHPIHTSASFHDDKELGPGGEEFASRGEMFDPAAYAELARHPKTVAIGECGLDYYRLEPGMKERQRKAFEAQIALANETSKPLMLHVRQAGRMGAAGGAGGNAYDDALDMLKAGAETIGNIHFFAGTKEQARKFLDLGFSLSFTGVITFAPEYADLVGYVPLDRLHAETDCPFAAPEPHRGRRNEPAFVTEVIGKVAEIKRLPLATVEKALLENAGRMFGITPVGAGKKPARDETRRSGFRAIG